MANRLRITLAQLNPTVGDLSGNAAMALTAWQAGKDAQSDLVMLPEMFLSGYQLQDLVRKPAFVQDTMAQLSTLAAKCADGPGLAIGAPFRDDSGLYNAYVICQSGRIKHRILKRMLPNTQVFDEKRTFTPADASAPIDINGVKLGILICEDAWCAHVSGDLKRAGAQVLLVPNGSPYARGRLQVRRTSMSQRVDETGLPLVYLNLVGAQDDQVFDGGSFALNPDTPHAQCVGLQPQFEESIVHLDLTSTRKGPCRIEHHPNSDISDDLELDYRACVQSVKDYCQKSGFERVLLGLSGGIDSALVAAIAVDALGGGAVRCVMLPSKYTSSASLDDAQTCAEALGCRYETLPIESPVTAVNSALKASLADDITDLTQQNIQSRLRGVLLMAMSNNNGEMLLTTGNKSEVAVGYSTIYGDMAGGYNPIKDVYKTRVFDLARWRNGVHRAWMQGPSAIVIPEAIITKPPSAELRPDQRDDDSLPPYEILDAILTMLIDEDASVAECVQAGYERETVKRVESLVYASEYKRFQSAPGTRLSLGAFWLDRRYPIVNRWRDPS